ncbi:uncharacterized protein LOC128867322 [Anastrepha ludens]|uniref:uncharacterized protein LOC128867322 n=1 Tax=Anastrepha ludens TaxID=28586 RepID=UPI0023AFF525|nr:uncharacterized protein LOC128867322 [Anastrepha ludens]
MKASKYSTAFANMCYVSNFEALDISTSSEACNANRSEESSYIENDQPIMKKEQETYQFNPEHEITLGKTGMINNKSQRLHAKQTISDNKISPGVNNNIPIEKKFTPNDLLELEEETVYGSPPARSKITADHRNKKKDIETACNVTDESSSIVSEECYTKNIEERKTASNDQEKISNLIASGSQIDENLLSFENQVNFGAGANANCTIRKDYSNLVESDQQIPSHFIEIANMAEGPEIDGASVSLNPTEATNLEVDPELGIQGNVNKVKSKSYLKELRISDSDIKIDKDTITEDQIESNKSKNIIFEKVISHSVTHGDKYNNNVSSLEETDSNLILKNTNESSAIINGKLILKNNDDTANVPRFEVKDLLSERIQEHINENYELPPHSNNQLTPKRSSDTAINEELIPKGNEEKDPSSFEIKEVISDKTDAKVVDNCESASHLDETISLASDKVSEVITNAKFILKNNDDTTNVPSFEGKELIPAGSHDKMDENFESPLHSYEQISIAPNKGSETSIKETILSKSNEEIKNPSSCEIKEVISDKSVERVADNNESAPHLIESISLVPVKVPEAVTNAKFTLKENENVTNESSFEAKELTPGRNHGKMDENYESPPHSTKPVAIAPNNVSETSVKETIIPKSNEEIKNPSSCEIKEVISDKSVERVADNNESAPHLIESISLVPVKVPEAVTNAKFTLKENENVTNESSFEAKELTPGRNHGKMDENYESPPHSTKPVAIAPNNVSETSVKETIIPKSNEEIKNPSSCEIKEVISDKSVERVADNNESAPHLIESISLVPVKVPEAVTNAKFTLKENENVTNESSFEAKELTPGRNHGKMDENYESPPHSTKPVAIAPNNVSETSVKETIIPKSNEEIKNPSSCEIKEVISDKSVERVADNNESAPHLIESISLVPVKVPEAVTNAKFTLKENENVTNESSFEAKELTPGRNHGKMDENYESPPHSTKPVAIAPNNVSETSVKETIIPKSNEEIKSPSSCGIEVEISDKTDSKVADNCESASHLDKAISLASDKESEVITNAKFILKNNDDTTLYQERIPAGNHEKMDENFLSPPHEQISIAPNKWSEISIKETILSKSNEEIKNPSSCEIKEVISDKSVERVADNNESAPHLIESISLVPVKVPEAVTNAKFTLKENENVTNESSFEAKELTPGRNHGKMDENYESPPHSTKPVAIAPNKVSETSVNETIISKSNEEIKSPSSCEIEEEISDKTDSKVADNCESASNLDKAISLASEKVSEVITNAKFILKNNDDTTNVPSFEGKELIPAGSQDKLDENFESPPHSYKQLSIAPNKGSETSVNETIISKSNEEIKSPSSCEIKDQSSDKTDSKVADNCESASHLDKAISLASDKVSEVITNAKFILKENENATNESSFESKELISAGNHEKGDENPESPPHSNEQISIAPNKGSETSIKETIISKSNEEIKISSSCEIKDQISDKTDSKVADNCDSASNLDKAISLASDKVSEVITNAKFTLKENENATNVSSFESKELISAGNHEKGDESPESPPHSNEQISISPNKGSEISIKETILSKSNEEIKNPSSCEIKEKISDKTDSKVADNCESASHLDKAISLASDKVSEIITNAKFTLKENENATNESSFEGKELISAANHEKGDENFISPPHSNEQISIAPNKGSETSIKETIIPKSNEEIKSPSSCDIKEVISDKSVEKVADNNDSVPRLIESISLVPVKMSEANTNAKFSLKENQNATNESSFEAKELIPARNYGKIDENYESPPHSTKPVAIAPNKVSETSVKETIIPKSNEEIKSPSSCEIKEEISDKTDEKVADNCESASHSDQTISFASDKESEVITEANFILKNNDDTTNVPSFEGKELVRAGNHEKVDENFISPPHEQISIAPNKGSENSIKETILCKSNEEIKNPSSCEIKDQISDKTDSKVVDNCESASHLDEAISLASDKVSEVITNAKFILKENENATNESSFESKELISAGNHEKGDENPESPPHSNEQISIAANKGSETSIKETIISKSNEEIKIPSSCEIKDQISDKTDSKVADNCESASNLDKAISLASDEESEVITNAKFILKNNDDTTIVPSFEDKELIPAGNHEKIYENFISPPHEQISIAPNKGSEISIKETILSKSNEEIKNPSSCEIKEVISDKSVEKVADNNDSVPHLIESISLVPVKVSEANTNAKFTLKENQNATNESSFEAKELIPAGNHEQMDGNYESPPHSNKALSIAPNKVSETSVKETIIPKSNDEIKNPPSFELKEVISNKSDAKVFDNCESTPHLDEIISPVANKLTEVITSAKFILKDNEDATNESSFEAKEEISKGAHEKMDANFDSPPHSNEQISIAPNKSYDTAINEEIISRANEEKSHPSSFEMQETGLEKPNKKCVDHCESRQHLINNETKSD